MPKVNEDVQQAMMLAWNRVKRGRTRQWSDWMVVGEGLLVGRKWAMRQAKANRPEGRKYALAFNEWLRRWKMDDMDKSDRAKLLQIMEERLAVEEYRQNVLTKHERDTLNSPTLFWRKWRASDRRKHRPTGTRLRRTNEQLQARVAELEEERDGLKAHIHDLEQALAIARGDQQREESPDPATAKLRTGSGQTDPILKIAVEPVEH